MVGAQLPERSVHEYPLFVKFLELYYEYAQSLRNAVSVIQNKQSEFDIDTALDDQLNRYLDICGPYIPRNTSISKPMLIKLLNDLYNSKGTEKSFKLLFRALYNVDVDITYPHDQILKASDGQWRQESFLAIRLTYGSPDDIYGRTIVITNSSGIFYITPSRVDQIDVNTYRVYYNTNAKVSINAGNNIEVSEDDVVIYRAVVVDSISSINIIAAGLHFSVGQIFRLQGSGADTYFKITAVDSLGAILKTEIIKYGYNHTLQQRVYISPYNSPPPASGLSITSVETPPGSGAYVHSVNIYEYVHTIGDSVTCVGSNTGTGNSYFLQDYVQDDYTGELLFKIDSYMNGNTPSNSQLSDMSMEDYLASRAIVAATHGGSIKTRGRYIGELGQLSNQSIKMQDNYYYQLFSYVVNTDLDITKYRDALFNIAHPAGMKSFSAIRKTIYEDISSTITADAKYTFRVDINDESVTSDLLSKFISLPKFEFQNHSEHIAKYVELPQLDYSSTTDESGNTTIIGVFETQPLTDVDPAKTLNKLLSDYLAEGYANLYFAESYNISAAITDNAIKQLN